MSISNNYTKEYTGIDTLIKINGYYYESSEIDYGPIVLTNYGGFYRYYILFNSHSHINEFITKNHSTYTGHKGSYKVFNDTIKAKWVRKYDLGSYDIYEEHFVILNDTTLKRIFYASKRIDRKEKVLDPECAKNIFKFYFYDFPQKN